jgi:hypothetical protein
VSVVCCQVEAHTPSRGVLLTVVCVTVCDLDSSRIKAVLARVGLLRERRRRKKKKEEEKMKTITTTTTTMMMMMMMTMLRT